MPQRRAALALARHYLSVDRPADALATLERAPEEEIHDAPFWLVLADALRQLDRADEGVDAARQGLELDPHDVALLDMLALCELARGNLDEAQAALEAALELSPTQPVVLGHLALARARAKDAVGARDAVAEAMRIAPESLAVLRVRAQVAWLTDDAAAERYVDELLAREPEDRIGHALRGNLAVRRKDYVPAARAFEQAARLAPSDADVARAARNSRIAAHPVLAPVRGVWRFGRWRAYAVVMVLSGALAAAGLAALRMVVLGCWVGIALLSWTAPRFLRWRDRRRYGGF
jgi:tetratricopeptide (TPR) repeat protein